MTNGCNEITKIQKILVEVHPATVEIITHTHTHTHTYTDVSLVVNSMTVDLRCELENYTRKERLDALAFQLISFPSSEIVQWYSFYSNIISFVVVFCISKLLSYGLC